MMVLHAFGQSKSQKVDMLWGPESKADKKLTLSDIVGYDETGIYTLNKRVKKSVEVNSNITLEHYDNKMAKTKSFEIDLKGQAQKRKFEFIIQLDNALYLFTSLTNPKLEKNFLYVQAINKKTLLPEQGLRKIAEINFPATSLYYVGNFNYQLSRDSTKALIFYNLPYKKGENESFGFHMFDKNMNQVWENNIILPYEDELFSIEDIEVDNNGNVHQLGKLYQEKRKEKRNGKPNYRYQIISHYEKGRKLVEYPVKVEGKFLTDMQIAINPEQDIICGGFYSAEGTTSIKGSYFLKIDYESKGIIAKAFQEFEIDFITQNMGEREKKKTKKKDAKGKSIELYQYVLDDIVLNKNGGAVLIGEQFLSTTRTETTTDANGFTTFSTDYLYYYYDIIVISLSPDGEIEWAKKIAKKQFSKNDGAFFSSYAHAVVKDKLYFIFNDNPKNLFYKGEGPLYNFNRGKESLVVLVTIDYHGNLTKEALFSKQEVGMFTRPMVCEQISGNEMVVFGQRGKNFRFAKITFKE